MRVVPLLLAMLLAGCGDDYCDESLSFARSDQLAAAQVWSDDNVFNKKIEYSDLEVIFLRGPGDTALATRISEKSGIVPEPFQQIHIVGPTTDPLGVFLSKGKFIGVLIAKGDVAEVLKIYNLKEETYVLVDDRTAMICGSSY